MISVRPTGHAENFNVINVKHCMMVLLIKLVHTTFSACRKVQELIHELKRYRWNLLGLAEVRWTGFRGTTMDEGHKIWYCGGDSKH